MLMVEANGAAIPAIGLGTSQLRGAVCAEMVATALGIGYRHVDTAAMYGNEEAVGEGIRASGIAREAVFVTTKVMPSELDEGDLQRAAEASLRRLGLSAVDLLLVHWPNPKIALARTMRALADAKRRGLARHVGVSNFTVALIEEATASCPEPLVTDQVEYHPQLDQAKVLSACRAKGMALTAYSPLGRGAVLREPAIAEIARAKGKSPSQIVLRWLIQQESVVAIPRTSKATRLAENLAVFDFALTEAEMAQIFALARLDGRQIDTSWAPNWDR
jgi:diketogulonate reductase-like aldo/keto reductase